MGKETEQFEKITVPSKTLESLFVEQQELLLTQYNYNLLNARQYLDNSIRSQFMKLK